MPNLPWRYRLTRSFIPPRPSWQTEPPEISTQRNRTRVFKGHLFISLTRALHEIQILPTISFFLENLPCVANRDSASLSGFVCSATPHSADEPIIPANLRTLFLHARETYSRALRLPRARPVGAATVGSLWEQSRSEFQQFSAIHRLT